jgi:excisionase family DNA binding protein
MTPEFNQARRFAMSLRNFHETDTLLTVDETAKLLKLPRSTVYELTRTRGQENALPLPAFKVGRRLRFSKAAIINWLTQLEKEATR